MMSTTSIAMHAARPMTSIWTGEGPALLAPSTTVAILALVTPNRSSSAQTSSAVTGGFGPGTKSVYGRLRRPLRYLPAALARREQSRERQPGERHHHEHVGEELAVAAVRTIWLRGVVPPLAASEEIRFHQLVESIDEQLDDEHCQEERGHLKEERQVDAMAVSRP